MNRELLAALLFILVVTVFYLAVATYGPADPGSLVRHGLGIIGFVLMLATETLYTLRKRKRIITWGGMRAWLSFHIFTGIIGPYLVFLHTGFRFAGLAGATTLMTGIVAYRARSVIT